MQPADVHGVILAAGKGTRMHSDRPKVMQEILGEPLLWYVIQALMTCTEKITVVTGHGAEEVETHPFSGNLDFVRQERQLGTGHALQAAWEAVENSGSEYCLVANGDTPLLKEEDIRTLLNAAQEQHADIAFLTTTMENPAGYGRIVRDSQSNLQAVIEAKDFDTTLHGPETGEVNAGVYCIRTTAANDLLFRLTDDNKQKEYYITQLIDLGIAQGRKVIGVPIQGQGVLFGINTPAELIENEEYLRARITASWIQRGVLVRNAQAVRIGPRVHLDAGSEITGPCELYGCSGVEARCMIESHCWIKDSRIRAGSRVRTFSHLEGADVGKECIVGPYARLRPKARVLERARVGNFVEMKNAVLGQGSKASHLTYIGDSQIGTDVNIGAGTITCNYDGQRKHTTVVQDNAFIGSNTALVAPVTVGKGALVGAGSTITKDVPDETIAVARGKLRVYPRKK